MADKTLISEIKSLRSIEIIALTALFLAIISPGFLVVFHFLPGVAETYETIKVVLLSISFSLPIYAANFFVIDLPNTKEHDGGDILSAVMAAFTSICAFYPSLYAAYYWQLNFATFVLAVCVVDAIALLFTKDSHKKYEEIVKKKKQEKANEP